MRAGARTSGASELREHDRGDPERGHARTLWLNSTAQINSEIAGALRARGTHGSAENCMCLHAMGRMGEGGALPSSPKDTKWSTETSWRRRSGALNLGVVLTERKVEAEDVEELVVRGTVVDVVEGDDDEEEEGHDRQGYEWPESTPATRSRSQVRSGRSGCGGSGGFRTRRRR